MFYHLDVGQGFNVGGPRVSSLDSRCGIRKTQVTPQTPAHFVVRQVSIKHELGRGLAMKCGLRSRIQAIESDPF